MGSCNHIYIYIYIYLVQIHCSSYFMATFLILHFCRIFILNLGAIGWYFICITFIRGFATDYESNIFLSLTLTIAEHYDFKAYIAHYWDMHGAACVYFLLQPHLMKSGVVFWSTVYSFSTSTSQIISTQNRLRELFWNQIHWYDHIYSKLSYIINCRIRLPQLILCYCYRNTVLDC